jgi:hypothetical protein
MKRFCNITIIFVFPFNILAINCPERISQTRLNRCHVQTICVYPGRTSTIDLPCKISKVRPGPAGDLHVKSTETEPHEVDLWLSSGSSKPTNLTVRCKDNDLPLVFDVIPSFDNHTDYYGVTGFSDFGYCHTKSSRSSNLIDSSSILKPASLKKKMVGTKKLIDSSSIKPKQVHSKERKTLIDSSSWSVKK